MHHDRGNGACRPLWPSRCCRHRTQRRSRLAPSPVQPCSDLLIQRNRPADPGSAAKIWSARRCKHRIRRHPDHAMPDTCNSDAVRAMHSHRQSVGATSTCAPEASQVAESAPIWRSSAMLFGIVPSCLGSRDSERLSRASTSNHGFGLEPRPAASALRAPHWQRVPISRQHSTTPPRCGIDPFTWSAGSRTRPNHRHGTSSPDPQAWATAGVSDRATPAPANSGRHIARGTSSIPPNSPGQQS